MTTTPDGRQAFHAQFYSHDSVGFGHVRRNLALAHALARELPLRTGMPGVGLVLTGEPEATHFPLPHGFDVLVLPGITKRGRRYAPRHAGFALDDLVGMRGALLKGLWAAEAPNLLVIDRHLLGIDGELRRGLKKLRKHSPHTKVVLGLREVLDSPEVAAREWDAAKLAAIDSFVDEVWVYGDPRVHDATQTGELPEPLASKAFFTGYLAHGRPTSDAPVPHRGERRILTTAGAGSADIPALLSRADAVLTMGGYNSVCEILASTAPALIVPRVVPRREQEIRARNLQRVGAVDVLHPRHLSADMLSAWLADHLGSTDQAHARLHLNLDGLATAAGHVVDTMTKEPTHV